MTNQTKPTKSVSRRVFLKRAAVAGGAVAGLAVAGAGGKAALDHQQRGAILTARQQQRPTGAIAWLTHQEYILLGALLAHLIPSDAFGPGAPEAQLVDVMDRLIATSAARRDLYAPGLLAFDELAQRTHGALFAELPPDQQLALLDAVDAMHQRTERTADNLPERALLAVERRARNLYHDWEGLGPALDLFPQLVRDAMQAFYTSQVAWDWLGYVGPPQPRGFVNDLGSCAS